MRFQFESIAQWGVTKPIPWLFPQLQNGIDVLSNQRNTHIVSLTCRIRAIVVGKTKWKSLKQLLPWKIVNRKQYHILRWTSAIGTTIKDLMGMVVPTTIPFDFPIWPRQKTDGFWRVTVDYCKLTQVVIPITPAVPDVILLLEQINTSLIPSMQLLIWKMLLS